MNPPQPSEAIMTQEREIEQAGGAAASAIDAGVAVRITVPGKYEGCTGVVMGFSRRPGFAGYARIVLDLANRDGSQRVVYAPRSALCRLEEVSAASDSSRQDAGSTMQMGDSP
jgi:hypothetical protein